MSPTLAPVARRLPPEEWEAKLVGTPLHHQPLDPEHTLIMVVEEDGQVVACWAALTCVHLEGLWSAPEGRGGAGRARALLEAMAGELTKVGVAEAITTAIDPKVEGLIAHVGGRQIPGSQWVIPLGVPVAPKE